MTKSVSDSSRRRIPRRASDSSSTIRTRILVSICGVGDLYVDAEPAITIYDLEFIVLAVELLQTLPTIAKSDAARLRRCSHAGPVIHNAQVNKSIVALRLDLNDPGICPIRDPVTDRVLDQRLKNQIRHGCV